MVVPTSFAPVGCHLFLTCLGKWPTIFSVTLYSSIVILVPKISLQDLLNNFYCHRPICCHDLMTILLYCRTSRFGCMPAMQVIIVKFIYILFNPT